MNKSLDQSIEDEFAKCGPLSELDVKALGDSIRKIGENPKIKAMIKERVEMNRRLAYENDKR